MDALQKSGRHSLPALQELSLHETICKLSLLLLLGLVVSDVEIPQFVHAVHTQVESQQTRPQIYPGSTMRKLRSSHVHLFITFRIGVKQ